MPLREVSSGKRGAWLLSESRALERLTDVLEERAVELAELGLDNDAYLPFAQQKKVQERLRQRWLESPDGQHYAAEARRKTSNKDSYKRTLESYYRTSQHEDYGGRLWQHLLGAVGSLPTRLISIVNEVCAERAERNQTFAASSAASSSAAALAPTRGITRGQAPRAERSHLEGKGVRHTRAEVYKLRRKCKRMDKAIAEQQRLWRS